MPQADKETDYYESETQNGMYGKKETADEHQDSRADKHGTKPSCFFLGKCHGKTSL